MHLEYFMSILLYLMAIWYTFWLFGIFPLWNVIPKKNLATLVGAQLQRLSGKYFWNLVISIPINVSEKDKSYTYLHCVVKNISHYV
jgi:hypothetical protein